MKAGLSKKRKFVKIQKNYFFCSAVAVAEFACSTLNLNKRVSEEKTV